MQLVFHFLEQLQAHNNTTRMHAHQPEYKQAKQTVLTLAKTLIDQISMFDPHINDLYPEETIFRLARDARFSKDKSPYKTNFGIVIAPGGKKSIFPCYYLHIQPGNHSFLAGGLYRPMPDAQKAVRDRLTTKHKEFQAILDDKQFAKTRGPLEGDAYKKTPPGYEATHPAIGLIKHKDRLVHAYFTDKQLMSMTPKKIVEYFKILHPFNHRLHQAIVASM